MPTETVEQFIARGGKIKNIKNRLLDKIIADRSCTTHFHHSNKFTPPPSISSIDSRVMEEFAFTKGRGSCQYKRHTGGRKKKIKTVTGE
jgi:hypothetical protein